MRALKLGMLLLPLGASIAAGQAAERPGPGTPAPRQQMERRLQQGLWRIAKERIGLTDAQMSRLTETSRRYDVRRRALIQDERAQRQTLRREILARDSANQDRIATAMDRLLQLQRQRLDMLAEEQRELAGFMTPLQRAQYAALQEQLRRRVESLRRARADSGSMPAR